MRFAYGHHFGQRGETNPNWKGGITSLGPNGYVQEKAPDHPRVNKRGYVYQHILAAERALGRYLRGTEEVHHWNHDRTDNRPENLLICPDRAYHFLIETRERALDACGNPNWRKCQFCKEYDDTNNLRPSTSGTANYHVACERRNQRERKRRKREAA